MYIPVDLYLYPNLGRIKILHKIKFLAIYEIFWLRYREHIIRFFGPSVRVYCLTLDNGRLIQQICMI